MKKHKNFQNFVTNTDRRNWKENVKNNKKIKEQTAEFWKKKLFHIYIFL